MRGPVRYESRFDRWDREERSFMRAFWGVFGLITVIYVVVLGAIVVGLVILAKHFL